MSIVSRQFPLLLALSVVGSISALHATDYTFFPDGSGESPRDWANSANWTPNGVPGAGDNVTLPALTGNEGPGLSAQHVTVANLTLQGDPSSAHVDLEGTLTVSNDFKWQGGSISAEVTIPEHATLEISGTTDKDLNGGSIQNEGTATWSGSGRILGAGDSVFSNSGTFTSTTDNSFAYSSGDNSATFINTGTFIKSGGTGVTYIGDYWAYNGNGTINVQMGTVQFGSVSNQKHELENGTQITGTGAVVVTDALDVQGTVTFGTGANLELAEGSVVGSDGNNTGPSFARFVGPGTLIWSGGDINAGYYSKGVFETGTDTHLAIMGSATKELDGPATFTNRGTAVWSGTGAILLNSGTFNNVGSFEAQNDASFEYNAVGYFNNFGLFTKSSSGTTTFDNVLLTNSGTMTISQPGAVIAVKTNDFAQSSTGVLNLAVDGSSYAKMTVDGDTVLLGTVNITLPNATKPTPGTSETLVSSALLDYGSANIGLPAGIHAVPSYSKHGLKLNIKNPATPLPLAALVARVHFTSLPTAAKPHLPVKGTFTVVNSGHKAAARFYVYIFATSANPADPLSFIGPSSSLVSNRFVVNLPAGHSTSYSFAFNSTNLHGKYLFFDVDPTGVVGELAESNDIVVVGPLE